MSKFKGIIILKPDLEERQIDFIQSDIVSNFEQKCKVKKIWYLGKRHLDHKIKKYNDGIFLKIELESKDKKIEKVRNDLKNNQNILFSIIINDNEQVTKVPKLPVLFNKKSLPNNKVNTLNKYKKKSNYSKVYMLISKNLKLPFSESNILAISTNKNTIFKEACEQINQFVYAKGYCTTKQFNNVTDIQKEIKKIWKIDFILGNSPNVGQELCIKEQVLI